MDAKIDVSLLFFLLTTILQLNSVLAKETEVRALVGTNVILPCRVDVSQCGILHSVKWYRDSSRIYVFSQAGQVARGEGDAIERMNVSYHETKNETQLQISKVQVSDEATYKCEITYLEVGENCDVVQIVKLTTLVKPAPAVITYNEKVVGNGTNLEEKNEGTDVTLICTSVGGKPLPKVAWYNRTNRVSKASYTTQAGGGDGLGTGISTLKMTLSRGDLNVRFECKVETPAFEEPEISWVIVGVKVRPTGMKLSGLTGHVVQGTTVTLNCEVFNARPAAEVRWYNGSETLISNDSSNGIEIRPKYRENEDGTFTTISSLVFSATRWNDGNQLNCYGKNDVMKDNREPALQEPEYLDVRYPPIITVSSTNTTVTEGVNITMFCTYIANPQRLVAGTWLKDGKNLTKIAGKHKHGTLDYPTIMIHNITRDDMGEYSCWLENEVGASNSDDIIFLDVLYPPDVEIIMRPSEPVKAVERRNVSLECNVTSGNPSSLRKVRWFLGGELMAELPECNYTGSTNESLGGPFCGIDPSILSLIKVEESFAGNYTCQGENEAGIGPVSDPKELVVFYPPSPAKLRYEPTTVIKKAEVTLECTVADPGRPSNVTYQWRRNGHVIHNVTVSKWKIPQASLETRSNFSCTARNEGGDSTSDFKFIKVVAPPAFIRTLNTNYLGVLYNSKNVNLTCRIECYPLCSIIWLKDGHQLNVKDNSLYYVNITNYPADYGKNDFESVESTLVWNMKNWPGEQLDKNAPHSNYTCVSVSADKYRTDVNFTTEIVVDFPPENLTVSKSLINVTENEPPEIVRCSGSGRPNLNYIWKNATIPEINKGDILQLPVMTRAAATGPYTCEAWNKYKNATLDVYFNVLYKPECSLKISERDGVKAIICTADANPRELFFAWRIREYNETFEHTSFIVKGEESYVILDTSADADRWYQCLANNTVGAGKMCEVRIPGSTTPWNINKENLIIIIASIIALIICVIVVCVVIIVLCRRKRQNTKCNNPLEMEEREKPDGQSPEISPNSKWPLRPGVLVQVSKMQNINISQLSSDSGPFRKSKSTSTFVRFNRNKTKVYARLRRLKSLIGFGPGHGIPSGITEGAGGVVTYTKIKPTSPISGSENGSRKRKKPGYAPNQSSTGDKMRLGAAPPVGGTADPANDHDKGFYENLPFHGMQNPPNKPFSVIAPFTQNSRARPVSPILATCPKLIQRHQSFHGFQNSLQMMRFPSNFNLSNPQLNIQRCFSQNFASPASNFQPILNFNPFLYPNPFSIPSKNVTRIVGRRESDIRRTASGINVSTNETTKTGQEREALKKLNDKRFGSLELKKHKCYSPTFYSMRCKKHGKKRPVVYALPKKVFGDLKPLSNKNGEIVEKSSPKLGPIPAPRCKKHRKEIIYQNTNKATKSFDLVRNLDVSNSSNDGSENLETQISVIEAQVHPEPPKLVGLSPKANIVLDSTNIIRVEAMKALKSSPMLKVSPNFIKPKTESPKGALSKQLQAKLNSSKDNINQGDDSCPKEALPLIPQMPLLSPQSSKWSPSAASSNQQQPYRPEFGDLEYADVDFKYGPINYKAASIYAAMKKNKNNNKLEEVNGKNDDLL